MRTIIKTEENLITLKNECLDYCNYIDDIDTKMTCEVEINNAKSFDELIKIEIFNDAIGNIISNTKNELNII